MPMPPDRETDSRADDEGYQPSPLAPQGYVLEPTEGVPLRRRRRRNGREQVRARHEWLRARRTLGQARLGEHTRRVLGAEHTAELLVAQPKPAAEDDLDDLGHLVGCRDVATASALLDGIGKLRGGLVADGEVARESPHQRVVERWGDVRAELTQPGDWRVEDFFERVDGVLAPKEPPPREALPEHDGHREDVALARAGASLVDALRREVGELAFHLVRARDLQAVLGLGDAEVREPAHAIDANQHVVR